MKSEPFVLPRNCGNCRWFDGDAACAVYGVRLIRAIAHPAQVVCAKHEPASADDVEGAAV